jgi:hypothetical protein
VDRQLAAGGQDGHQHDLSVLGVDEQRLDVDPGAERVLEQRDVVEVDGQEVFLGLRDERQRGAAGGGLRSGGNDCGHW